MAKKAGFKSRRVQALTSQENIADAVHLALLNLSKRIRHNVGWLRSGTIAAIEFAFLFELNLSLDWCAVCSQL